MTSATPVKPFFVFNLCPAVEVVRVFEKSEGWLKRWFTWNIREPENGVARFRFDVTVTLQGCIEYIRNPRWYHDSMSFTVLGQRLPGLCWSFQKSKKQPVFILVVSGTSIHCWITVIKSKEASKCHIRGPRKIVCTYFLTRIAASTWSTANTS